jgi:hypothetical protein
MRFDRIALFILVNWNLFVGIGRVEKVGELVSKKSGSCFFRRY